MTTRTVLLFGDSNTHGTLPLRHMGDRRRLGPGERWPGICRAALGLDWTLIEEGHPGRTTVHPDPIEGIHKNGIAVLPALLESHRPLDGVVVMLGTNDLKARYSVTAWDIAQSIEKLIGVIRQMGCGSDGEAPAILVVSPPPILETGVLAETFTGGAAKSEALAGHLATVADTAGVAFFDAGSAIQSSPVDGIHFEADAHTVLGEAIAHQLLRLPDLHEPS